MASKTTTLSRWLTGAVILAMMDFAVVVAANLVVTAPAQAQYREYSPHAAGPRYQRAPNFFDRLFGPSYGPVEMQSQPQQQQQFESTRAPPPKKSDTTPTLSIMVLGDSMADWLAYGLEDAFSDSPELGVVRKSKTGSGLLRYEARSDLDWWHVARDELGKQKTDIVVMMLGINDRQPFRESQSDKKDKAGKDTDKKSEPDKTAAPDSKAVPSKEAGVDQKTDDGEQPSILAPEPRSAGGARGVTDFRTERWEEIYTKRIDDTIAALKSKGVPVIWVGLPPLRGTRSTSDVQYLNDLYRARAEKAGIVYVDVWDGFVDEAGKFTTRGPDFEGQVRSLRSGDGVHFTKSGARKLAHYVERELRRFISNRAIPMALPADAPAGSMTPDGRPGATVRPVAGPVVPLTAAPGAENDELLGGNASRPTHADPTATRVLVKGEPVAPPPGRADDFAWPRPGDASAAIEPLSPTAAAARGDPDAKPGTAKNAKDASKDTKKGKTLAKDRDVKPNPALNPAGGRPGIRAQQPPAPQQQQRSGGPFGWLR